MGKMGQGRMWQAMRTAMFLALLLSMACVAMGQETTVEETTEEDDVNATTTAMAVETTPTPGPRTPPPVTKAVLPKGEKIELAFGGKKLIVLLAKGEVKDVEVKVATIKGPNGAEIVYPAIGASEFIEPEGYPGKILTGQAIDVKFTLPDGADYGVDIDLGILFNNDGTLPVKARRAAAPEGYDFRVNGDCACPASTDFETAKCEVTTGCVKMPLLVKSADCVVTTDSTLAIALGAGLGVGIPVIAIAAYFLFFRKSGTTSPSNAVP
jgi:hypothetical protein